MMTFRSKKYAALYIISALFVLYGALLIPDFPSQTPVIGDEQPFEWNSDAQWDTLERRFQSARLRDCSELNPIIERQIRIIEVMIDTLDSAVLSPDAPLFDSLEGHLFHTAPLLAACPDQFTRYLNLFNRARTAVKRQSVGWDATSRAAKRRLYRLLYGGRIAIEEVMLQLPRETVPALTFADDEPSHTPAAQILGMTIHSGDVLVSRGGAPTSALIARGNDYPGNFSHIALVHIEESTGRISIVESLIEHGVVVTPLEEYLNDKKLRVMPLRLRADLPALQKDPLLPHHAATLALQRARAEHVLYDFAMDHIDTTKLFCSEVASNVYGQLGLQLWPGVSHISSPGVASWLAAFGVEIFKTLEPSDLEYDPQFRVIAEWRDPETLFQDHVDNAVTDVMLEGAERGERLHYDWYALPLARLLKAYCSVLNLFGGIGPIPEGLSATAALKIRWFKQRHGEIQRRTLILANEFTQERGYVPPYWELVKLARAAKVQIDAG